MASSSKYTLGCPKKIRFLNFVSAVSALWTHKRHSDNELKFWPHIEGETAPKQAKVPVFKCQQMSLRVPQSKNGLQKPRPNEPIELKLDLKVFWKKGGRKIQYERRKTSKLFFEKDKRHFRCKQSFNNLSYGLWSTQALLILTLFGGNFMSLPLFLPFSLSTQTLLFLTLSLEFFEPSFQ